MPTVSQDTRFIGYAPDVNLQEKKSGINNTLSEPYTMQDIAAAVGNGSTPTGIPYVFYPPAGITTGGPKFTYTDGIELISYHIKGIDSIQETGNNFYQYLCTVDFGVPYEGIFPGSVTGSFQCITDGNIITTPLANGGLLYIDGIGAVNLTDFTMYLYPYENPQPNGHSYYALVATANLAETGAISGLMSYDFEFLLPDYIPAPTIFQD